LIGCGYVKPVYLAPIFQTMIGYGTVQCPFKCPHYAGEADYREGLCPNTEASYRRVITHEMMRPSMSERDLDDVADAFYKVADNVADMLVYANRDTRS
jgi:perosamine synthetase